MPYYIIFSLTHPLRLLSIGYVRKKFTSIFAAFSQHLAAYCAKCAFRALQRVAYGIDLGAAYCRIQKRGAANCAFCAFAATWASSA